MARYKYANIKSNKTNESVNVPTVPILENSTSTKPTAGMILKYQSGDGMIANDLLKELNCIYNAADKTTYTNLSKTNSSTTYTIYDLSAKKKLTYKNGSQTASADIPSTDVNFVPGILLYDKNTKKLFFVKDLSTIIPIVLG